MSHFSSDELFVCLIGLALAAFVITSVVLFIVDCVKAKREHRRIKVGILVMFIIAMHSALCCAAIMAFLWILGYAIMTSM